MATVALVGTLDTKGAEYAWLAAKVKEHGAKTLQIDVGPLSTADADVTPAQVAAAAGKDLPTLLAVGDRGPAMAAMAEGSAAIVAKLYQDGAIDAVLALGGSGGSSVASAAMRALPVGVPKLLVSTMAAGDVSPYVGQVDITMMYSVVDVAGINSISEKVFANAAAAAAAMAIEQERRREGTPTAAKPLIGMTMFGLTTPAANEAREELESLGYEVLVFHATGSGGLAMEKLASDGFLAGVLDLTTTELADDLVGGVLTAGPNRLEAAGKAGVPQLVSLGALDMVNFGPEATIPAVFADRKFLVHNPTVTLMRTTAAEMAELGKRIGTKVAAAKGPSAVFIPLRGVSGIDAEGKPFWDAEADAAMFAALRAALSGSDVPIIEVDEHINDPGFGRRAAQHLHSLITGAS